MSIQVLFPEFFPQHRLIDFPQGDQKPIDKSFLAPSPAYSLPSIDDAAECALNGIGRQWNPSFSLKPTIKHKKDILRKIDKVGSGLRVFFRIKGVDQFLKPFFNLFNQLYNNLFLRWQNLLQHLLGQPKERNFLQKLAKRELLSLFQPILKKKNGKISLSMPDASLLSHTFREKVVFNARTTIREKHLQFPVVQSLLKVLANECPVLANPKPNRFKPSSDPLRSQSPTHLSLSQRLSSWPPEP